MKNEQKREQIRGFICFVEYLLLILRFGWRLCIGDDAVVVVVAVVFDDDNLTDRILMFYFHRFDCSLNFGWKALLIYKIWLIQYCGFELYLNKPSRLIIRCNSLKTIHVHFIIANNG